MFKGIFTFLSVLGLVALIQNISAQESSSGHSTQTQSVEAQGLENYKIPDECPEWIKKLEGVPECPKGEGKAKILPENFPIGVFVINAGPGAHMPTAEKLADQILDGAEVMRRWLQSFSLWKTLTL